MINFEKEYIRLWNAAEQALENIDLETHTIASWASLAVLKIAVEWGRSQEIHLEKPLPHDSRGHGRLGNNMARPCGAKATLVRHWEWERTCKGILRRR